MGRLCGKSGKKAVKNPHIYIVNRKKLVSLQAFWAVEIEIEDYNPRSINKLKV